MSVRLARNPRSASPERAFSFAGIRNIGRIARGLLASTTRSTLGDREFRRAILSGYPDRVGHRRERGSARVKLATGPGAVLSGTTGVTEAEFLVALDVRASSGSAAASPTRWSDSADSDRVIHMASQVEPEWLTPSVTETRTWFDEPSGQVRAVSVERYGAIILREHPCAIDDERAAHVLAEAWLQRGPGTEETRLLRRLEFAGREVDVVPLVRAAAYGHRSLRQVNLMRAIDASLLRVLDHAAPEMLLVPSGRAVRLEYEEGGRVTAAVKLQELFGLAETPRIGPRREPVVFALLSPSGRPVQVTKDLRSFWDRTYPDVRRELRGRYPRHPWPEDPWRATPTARTRRRGS